MALDYADTAEDMPEEAAAQGQSALQTLIALSQMPNIAESLDETFLNDTAQKVVSEYQADNESRKEWSDRIEAAMSLAMMVAEEKSYPFEKASNVKAPILAEAALQFNARAYPAIVPASGLVKGVVSGRDQTGAKAARGERVSEYMSYEILNRVKGWDEDTDRMLVMLPIVGCVFRKTWRDPAKGKCTRLVTAKRLVVNYWAQSLDSCPRYTEEIDLYPDEIETRIRSGRFIDFDYTASAPAGDGEQANQSDDYRPHRFLEQHRLLDLDQDGYPEPYVVTVHEPSQKVVRVAANFTVEGIKARQDGTIVAIERAEYYTKYDFLPNPEGGFYGLGFGWLLKDLSETINSTLNQMLDAGHLANIQGGLISGALNIKDKHLRIKQGEWKVINTTVPLNQAVLPITYPGPAAVLFNLLGLLVEWTRDVTATKDVLTGEGQGKNASPTTTLALIEQGLQVFTSIYKRIYRGLRHEFKLFAMLCAEDDPETYNRFLDDPNGQFNPAEDFNLADMDITPVADPNAVSKMQKLAKAQFVMETAQGNPMVNQPEALKRMYEAANIEDAEKLIVPPPPPDPEQEMMLKVAALLELMDKDAQIDKTRAETVATETGAMKDIADASQNAMLGRARLVLDALKAELSAEQEQMRASLDGQGRVPGMEGQPANPMGSPAIGPQGGAGAGSAGGQVAPMRDVPAAGMGSGPAGGGL